MSELVVPPPPDHLPNLLNSQHPEGSLNEMMHHWKALVIWNSFSVVNRMLGIPWDADGCPKHIVEKPTRCRSIPTQLLVSKAFICIFVQMGLWNCIQRFNFLLIFFLFYCELIEVNAVAKLLKIENRIFVESSNPQMRIKNPWRITRDFPYHESSVGGAGSLRRVRYWSIDCDWKPTITLD